MSKKNLPSFVRSKFNFPISNWSSPFLRMDEELEQLFSNFPSTSVDGLAGSRFVPSCTADETDKEFILKFDVPGMDKDDLKIELEDNRLTVTGERKEEKKEKGKNTYSEVSYGAFSRSITLPTSIDEEKTSADYEKGVLTIKAAKAGHQSRREIHLR